MPLTFELAHPDHAEALLAIRIAASKDLAERYRPGPRGSGGKLESIQRRLKEAQPDNLLRGTTYVVTDNDECLGSLTLAIHHEDFWPQDCWQASDETALGVFGLSVDPVHQRKGVGTLLMRESERLTRERGYKWIRLDTYERNTMSNAFYQKLGYWQRAVVDLNGNSLVLYELGL